MNTRRKLTARRLVMTAIAAIAIPLSSVAFAQSAAAIGDVCDLCSINFDPTACDASGFAPYDSTVTDRYGNPLGGSAPAPAPAPAPAAPAPAPAPAPVTAPPASSGGGTTTAPGRQATTTPTAPGAVEQPAATEAATAQSVPSTPAAPDLTVDEASLVITWVAPADGGSPITGYQVALNGGAVVDVAPGETSYTFERLTEGDYSATVVAANALGVSPVSPASSIVSIADTVTATTVSSTTAAAADDSGPSSLVSGALILLALVAVAGIVLLANFVRTSGGIAAVRAKLSRAGRTAEL